jgi:hypothetical protein
MTDIPFGRGPQYPSIRWAPGPVVQPRAPGCKGPPASTDLKPGLGHADSAYTIAMFSSAMVVEGSAGGFPGRRDVKARPANDQRGITRWATRP